MSWARKRVRRPGGYRRALATAFTGCFGIAVIAPAHAAPAATTQAPHIVGGTYGCASLFTDMGAGVTRRDCHVPAGQESSSAGQASAGQNAGRTWEHVPALEPRGRINAAAAYDSSRGEGIMFGGNNSGYFNDTWVWRDGRWLRQEAAASPAPQEGAAMAYDAAREEMVLFDDAGLTWTWNGSSWAREAPASSPPTRDFAALTYDAARRELVLFGGNDAFGDPFGDTWTWDGSTWTQEQPESSPPARAYAAMAYDSARGEVVLFGGRSCEDEIRYLCRVADDTWTWDGSTWAQRHPEVSPPPQLQVGMSYDAEHREMLLYAAYSADGTWAWDGSSWEQRTQDSPGTGQAFVTFYDADAQRTIVFGGTVNGAATWTWDGASWSRVDRTSPPAQYLSSAAYDRAREESVLLSGYTGTSTAQTWTWDGRKWQERRSTSSPAARIWSAMASEVGGGTVVFGGCLGNSCTNHAADTWTWNGTRWNEQHPAEAPSARHAHTMAYDVARDQVVLFGGTPCSTTACTEVFGDTWVWDGSTWSLRRPATSPPARAHAAMAYDAARGEIVLFGGMDRKGTLFDDTWVWDGNTWHPRPSDVPPAARVGHSMAYDYSSDAALLFGGATSTGWGAGTLDDAWLWDGSQWTEASPDFSPEPRWFSAMAEHASSKTVVLFGGQLSNPGNPTDDTWTWGAAQRLRVLSPRDGAILSEDSVMLTGTAAPGSTITVTENGTLLGSAPVGADGRWDVAVTLSEGLHRVSVMATDASGQPPDAAELSFQVDVSAPAAPEIAGPSAGSLVGPAVILEGVGEPGSRLRLYDQGILIASARASAAGHWDAPVYLSGGDHRVTAVALDDARNGSAPSVPVHLEVDAGIPDVSIDTADGTVFLPTETVTVQGAAGDEHGVARIDIVYRDVLGQAVVSRRASCSSCGREAQDVTWSDEADVFPGIYTVEVTAVDVVGNPSVTARIRIAVL